MGYTERTLVYVVFKRIVDMDQARIHSSSVVLPYHFEWAFGWGRDVADITEESNTNSARKGSTL